MDDLEDKSWGSIADQNQEVMDLLNIKHDDIPRPQKPITPIMTKYDYSAPIKWQQTIDPNILQKVALIKKSKTHIPIPHERVLGSFQGAITNKQMVRIAEKGLLSEDGTKYFYMSDVVLRINKDKPIKNGYIPTVGFINFNNKQLWGCSPLRGETMFNSQSGKPLEFFTKQGFTSAAKIKHTKTSIKNIQTKCRNMVIEFSAMKNTQRRHITIMKKMEFSDRYLGYVVLNLIRKLACGREILSVKSIENLIDIWSTRYYPNTLWGFHHAFTETFQKWDNPTRRLKIYDYYYILLMELIKNKSRII